MIIVFAYFPSPVDALAIAGFAMVTWGYGFVAAFCLGVVMAPLGDGIVLPACTQMKSLGLESKMPMLQFTAAPVEVITCLFLFGVLQVCYVLACLWIQFPTSSFFSLKL